MQYVPFRFIGLALVGLLTLSACASRGGIAQGAGLVELCEREPNAEANLRFEREYFQPKVSLDRARFCVLSNGQLFCELSNDQRMLFRRIEPQLSVAAGYEPFVGGIPASQEDKLFRLIPENHGDFYTALFFENLALKEVQLRGLTLRFSGAGTYDGLMGELGPTEVNADDWEAVGLVFLERFTAKGEVNALPSFTVSDEDAQAIRAEVSGVLKRELKSFRIVERLYLSFPDVIAVLVEAGRLDGDSCLCCVGRLEAGWLALPFTDLSYAIEGSPVTDKTVLFHQAAPEAGYAFSDPHLFPLPDIDGNGASEFILKSGITSVLFAIEERMDSHEVWYSPESGSPRHKWVVKEIRGISFAS